MRKLLYVAAVAAAALALAAPATATEAVLVVTEPGGVACTTSTCNTGMSSSGAFERRGHFLGFESHTLDCTMAFSLGIGAGGAGTITGFVFGGQDGCSETAACATPWAFEIEETAANTSQMDVALCVNGASIGECEGTLSLAMVETGTNHRYSLSVNDGSLAGESFGHCEITGSWVHSGTINGFEILHQ